MGQGESDEPLALPAHPVLPRPDRGHDVVRRDDVMSAEIPLPPLEPHSEYVRLERAVLCADCDAIYNMVREKCPSCAGGSALALALVLSSERHAELIEGLRSVSKLLAWAKRPMRKKEKAHAVKPPAVPAP